MKAKQLRFSRRVRERCDRESAGCKAVENGRTGAAWMMGQRRWAGSEELRAFIMRQEGF